MGLTPDIARSDDSAARGEIQLHRICIALCAGLDDAEVGQLLQPLSGYDLNDSRIADPVAVPNKLECRICRGERSLLALQGISIVFQSVQGIGHLTGACGW
jgi:hypothetical protein